MSAIDNVFIGLQQTIKVSLTELSTDLVDNQRQHLLYKGLPGKPLVFHNHRENFNKDYKPFYIFIFYALLIIEMPAWR